jgi:N-acyl-phosphatidylethanolamine-hydrolysing phospholipase D
LNRRAFVGWLAALLAGAGAFRLLLPRGAPPGTDHGGRRTSHDLPSHHHPGGGFRNPWPGADEREPGGVFRWQRERRSQQLPPDPEPHLLPRAEPDIAHPRAAPDELRVTWVGHATFLIQIGGLNLLTDPQWSRRASPVQFAGPDRFSPPGVEWDRLPPIDAVLLSHDHYDHLDDRTARRIRRTFRDGVRWFTPLGYRDWFAARDIRNVETLDWWNEAALDGPHGAVRIVALPCQHWTSRVPWDRNRKLWAAWAVIAPRGHAVLFGGDSGYFPDYPEIADRLPPMDAVMLPIGAYEPRWFMRPVHMNPEEAVRAYLDLGGTGTMLPMHWGTWRLTDEDPLEPPVRIRAAWAAAGLPEERLRILPHGGTWIA